MLIKAIEVGYLQTNCYIVADEATLDAAVIDPGADSNLILDYIERCHFHVRAILLTHGHFDHCMGLEEVYDATGATVYMSHADLTTDIGNGMFGNEDFELDPPDDTVFVREGDVIEAGSLTFDVLETPGHTPGGITYRCEDCLFTGDTLFRMSCGRYDFPGSSSLDLGHCHLSAVPFVANMPHLRHLILADDLVYDISPLENLKELEWLELFNTAVQDPTPLLGCTALRDLNVCYISTPPDALFETLSQMTWLRRSAAWPRTAKTIRRRTLPARRPT